MKVVQETSVLFSAAKFNVLQYFIIKVTATSVVRARAWCDILVAVVCRFLF